MSDQNDFNAAVIGEFRANRGAMVNDLAGRPIVLVHHTGRRTGKPAVSPLIYWRDRNDEDTVYVFASAGGAPQHPAWYFNLTAAGRATVELGAETYDVTVREVNGSEHDRIYAANAQEQPQFIGYQDKATERIIPVLALERDDRDLT